VKLKSAFLTSSLTLMSVIATTPAAAQPATTPASAQPMPRAVDVSVGYQLLHIPDETFPFGINVDASGRIGMGLKAVGEFGWARDQQTEPGVSGTLNFVNWGGGVRWSPPVAARAARRPIDPYVQLLVGAVHADANLTVGGARLDTGNWAFMLQPGAGVAVPIAPVVSAIGQVDYRRAFFESGENEFRFVVGVRFAPR
jgi:Outer membrane protein beta-barrel domain